MRWVKDGPDIPVEIAQAVEEGRVVFFCGAGVSQQSDLPSFKGLVEAVYKKLHRRRESFPAEEKAFRDQNYDQVFASLEAAIKETGLIRRLVAESLALAADADTSTHKALLTLATDRNSKCRLVTTNHDRCFLPHLAAGVRIDAAPRLPVPRPGRWNSVVHLHGYLDDCGDDGRELVLSSADFGAAYLVDGWATRFLRELFQHFIVLFVGYRAEDLVVKHMLQALAVGLAERGEKPRAFALAQVENTEQSTTATWEAKGITPILYPKGDSHDALHATLRAWAEAASHGLLGRRSIVAERLLQPPPSDHDEVVDQVLWALQDENGATAKYLAEHEAEDGYAEPFWIRLEKTCGAGSLGRAARALAAIRTAWLFESRPEWTRTTLLPCFDWKLSDEAKLVWKGFTFGATFSPSLWSALRDDFIATFDNLGQLDAEAVRVFHQLIGRIAIHEPTWLTDDEAQRIVTLAPHVGREQIAWVFWTSLDAAGEKAGSLWRDRIGPWLSACWQPDEVLKEPDTSMNLIRVALAAGDAIPEAVDAVLSRMSPVDHPEGAIFLLAQSKAPEEFPLKTVKLLDRAILRSRSFYKGDLEKLLGRIASAWAEAGHDLRFRNLSDFAAG